MKWKWKKRLNGAISIFLAIIFVSNYALIGLLVDSGRLRMARAVSEGALDSASASVLSYYNQMLYDLYGLFATDSLSEDKIIELLTDYTEKTLGVAEVDESTVKSLVAAVTSAMEGAASGESEQYFDLYNFDTNITMVENESVTLANTEAVEAQIIDHMKYRAPQALVGDMDGFVEKLEGLFSLTERLELTKDKLETTKGKEQLFADSAELIQDVDAFNKRLLAYTSAPHLSLATGGDTPYDPYDYLRDLDTKFDGIENRMNEALAELAEEEEEEEGSGESEESIKAQFRREFEGAADAQALIYAMAYSNADALYRQANELRDRAYGIADRYESYINELKGKLNEDPDNENYKTVYLPEIELAESSCGEMLKNIDLVLMSRAYTDKIAADAEDARRTFQALSAQVIDYRIDGEDGEGSVSSSLETMAANQLEPFGKGMGMLLDDLKEALSTLNEMAKTFRDQEEVTIKTVDSDGGTANSKTEEKVKKDELRDLKSEDLSVPYETVEEEDWDESVTTTMDSEETSALIGAGLDLIKKIGEVLEGARDSLYINEYAIAYFPNYVQHYNAVDKDIAKNAQNAYLMDTSKYFYEYNATQAELEYILTGDADTGSSVANISARLLGIRMALNTAAIFTDSAKVAQANALAASISGPFAPLVSVGLLIAWALAESVLDVASLLDGEEVELFKQGKSWKMSVEGIVSEVVEKAVDYVGDEVTDAVNGAISDAAGAVEQVANRAVYDAFQKASSSVEAASSAAQSTLSEWSQELGSAVPGVDAGTVSSAFNSGVGAVESEALSLIDNTRDKALVKVNQSVRSVSDKLQEKVNGLSDDLKKKATEAITNSLNKILPSGQVVNTGSNTGGVFEVKLDYMDYMRIFLLFAGNKTKVQRIQQLIQANLRYGGQEEFAMNGSYVSISSKLDGQTRFLFMSAAFLPADLKRDGKMNFTVYSRMGY
ncbi:DUF5702 domain-containing protein [Angelakisella massiliensis]|uniref:DUF5702 domain-containing protein n=1 Tax=Angelakisella massiliensis TaxID=1871018 RepID=UPI0024B24AA8|nr:DUF5702 domain-containing protein [Angelakisella massiliensis]